MIEIVVMLKIITVAFENTKYMICGTHIPPNGSMVHTLQGLATNMSQNHELILPRIIMRVFARAKCGSCSIFKCDQNALICKVIGREMNELREFFDMSPKNGKFRLAPSVPQIAVTKVNHASALKTMSK